MIRRTVLVSLGLLVSAGIASAETLDGRWTAVAGECNTVTDSILTIDTVAGTLRYWESVCTITSMTPIGTFEMAWQLSFSCAGEGDTWQREAILGVVPPFDGNGPSQLFELDLADGFTIARTYCGPAMPVRTK